MYMFDIYNHHKKLILLTCILVSKLIFRVSVNISLSRSLHTVRQHELFDYGFHNLLFLKLNIKSFDKSNPKSNIW